MPLRQSLTVGIESRVASISKDSRMVNCYKETVGNTSWVVKRPGLSALVISPALAAADAGGMCPFQDTLNPIVGTTLYKVTTAGVSSSRGTVVNNLGTDSSDIYSCVETATTPYLFLHNSTNAYTVNGASQAFAEVTDADFPTKQAPAYVLAKGAVYLDGTVYVMTTTGRIYNSAIENPTSWGALDFVTKESEPDGGVAIVKHRNFLIAFGKYSAEFFYNNANPTGSPLSRNDTLKLEIGCAEGNTVSTFPHAVMWVGQTRESGRAVYLLEGGSPTKVSTKSIEFFLSGLALTNVRAFSLTIPGHNFYILSFGGSNGYTFVYDLNEKHWTQWTSDKALVEKAFDDEFYTSIAGISYVLDKDSGGIYKVSVDYYKDAGNVINFRVVTPLIDGNTNVNKFFSSLELIGDKVDTTVSIRHTSDDYNTWTSYRTVNMNVKRPIIRQLGSSRRRAFDIWHTGNTALRLEGMELAIKAGVS